MRLTVLITWWKGWRPIYQVEHVNALAGMLREHLKIPFKLVLLTDEDATGAQVDEVRPAPADPKGLRMMSRINCFRRLRFFDPAYSSQFGTEWVMSIDLDTLIRGDITEMVETGLDHPYGLWILRGRHAGRKPGERPYNGAMYMIRVGAHADVWHKFDPIKSPREIARRRWIGSDQSWIGIMAPDAPTWGPDQGVWFFGQYLQRTDKAQQANVLNFAGNAKPWAKPVKFQCRQTWKEYTRWLPDPSRPASTAASTS